MKEYRGKVWRSECENERIWFGSSFFDDDRTTICCGHYASCVDWNRQLLVRDEHHKSQNHIRSHSSRCEIGQGQIEANAAQPIRFPTRHVASRVL